MELRGQVVSSHSASRDILTELVTTIFVFWDITPHRFVYVYQYFGRDCCLIFRVVQEEYAAQPTPCGLPSRRRQQPATK